VRLGLQDGRPTCPVPCTTTLCSVASGDRLAATMMLRRCTSVVIVRAAQRRVPPSAMTIHILSLLLADSRGAFPMAAVRRSLCLERLNDPIGGRRVVVTHTGDSTASEQLGSSARSMDLRARHPQLLVDPDRRWVFTVLRET
jgi:hypothetical protein